MNKPHNFDELVAAFISGHGRDSLLCLKCGIRMRKVYWNGKIICSRSTCGQKECHHMYGKKRPEHSKRMKELSINGSDAYKETLMKKGELFNKEVNSISFLRKKLEGRGYEVSLLSDEEVKDLNRIEESRKTSTIEHKVKTVITKYSLWEKKYKDLCLQVTGGIEPSVEYFDSLDESKLRAVLRGLHGVNTIRNGDGVKTSRAKWFHTGVISGFHHNMDGKDQVYVKSGLEEKYIRLFESKGWPWSYESINLMTESGKFYTPDFIVEIAGKTYLLEAKGNFYRQDKDSYLKNEVQAAIRYCNEVGYVYILSQVKNPDETLNFIKDALVNSEVK